MNATSGDDNNRKDRAGTNVAGSSIPQAIEVRGARVHNLQDIDVSIPLNELVGIAGVSGSGKSSLALGVLYAEGSRRYLDALSTYTRRRMTQAEKPQVDSVRFIPPALALRQRPDVGGMRSTFGTSTETLNVLRLMFSRLASHRCPNGHYQKPTLDVAAEIPIHCAVCGALVEPPSAEQMAFNSTGACPKCQGTGTIHEVNDSALVPDENLTIDEGAVVPWRTFGFNVQPDIVREFGVRTDVPFKELTDKERDVVFNGPEEKKPITITSIKGVHHIDFTFRNARLTVTKELDRANDEKRLAKVSKFLVERTCPDCGGSRLNVAARAPKIGKYNLAEVTAWPLRKVLEWAKTVPESLPQDMRQMAESLVDTLEDMGRRLIQLGLGYLTLDRASTTLSTGERQRAQLSRAVRNETTGVLYVLDEPSTGLHPANIEGLIGVMRDLLASGNSVVFVDHDVHVLNAADYFIEMGPGAGSRGGRILAQGAPAEILHNPKSRIAGFLDGSQPVVVRKHLALPPVSPDLRRFMNMPSPNDEVANYQRKGDQQSNHVHAKVTSAKAVTTPTVGDQANVSANVAVTDSHWITMATDTIHTVHPLHVAIPRGRMTAVTGVSGSGKTTMILESLIPALQAQENHTPLPSHVRSLDAAGITRVRLVDSTPIGINVRSTVATYTGIMDMLRKAFASTASAKKRKLKVSAFSYNTGTLRCPQCDGTGQISLDIQFLPDVTIICPTCEGRRYRPEVNDVRLATPTHPQGLTLPEVLDLEVDDALDVFALNADFGSAAGSSSDSSSRRSSNQKRLTPAGSTSGLSSRNTSNQKRLSALSGASDANESLNDSDSGDMITLALLKRIHKALETLHDLGLGYLTLGEDTPNLSGGEAQRLKLSNELGKRQSTSLFVLDEPTTGLHPLDVRTLIDVLQRLIKGGATVIFIEHDLDMIANADYVIDMGPGGGEEDGTVVATGTPDEIADDPASITGRYLAQHLAGSDSQAAK
ncbi:excinuclease ABC subunit UvrA [Bifidobacterium sp. ESL0728]|uniref:excinuclease ABC subunit UvrA n=1 Tax=Bifidobacterium sp. ESL0728 TaxID=2983220 RepID=UPI0023F7D010|nr:excinuclease ABC subunit UvrA [Bifidobacterium sp. ESL0728]WEV59532.1 excinuclease ABC subunit UvrA [Bifidobacterium sp. ESL0728]